MGWVGEAAQATVAITSRARAARAIGPPIPEDPPFPTARLSAALTAASGNGLATTASASGRLASRRVGSPDMTTTGTRQGSVRPCAPASRR